MLPPARRLFARSLLRKKASCRLAVMEAPFDTTFLVRRHTQLLVQAAHLPERSSAQAHIEELACRLSDYVSALYATKADLREVAILTR